MKNTCENNDAVHVENSGCGPACNTAAQTPEKNAASLQKEAAFWRDAKYAQEKDISER